MSARSVPSLVLQDGFSGWNNSIHVFDTESSRWSELIAQVQMLYLGLGQLVAKI